MDTLFHQTFHCFESHMCFSVFPLIHLRAICDSRCFLWRIWEPYVVLGVSCDRFEGHILGVSCDRFEGHMWFSVFPVIHLRAICGSETAFKIKNELLWKHVSRHFRFSLNRERVNNVYVIEGGVSLWCKALNSEIIVREFVLQSRDYVHFQTNTLGKGMNPLILLAMG